MTVKTRVMVVDDSMLFRKVVRNVLADMSDVEVIGVAGDGKMALEKIDLYKPDLITLDIEMPQLDGLGVLQELRKRKSDCGAIMLSALTSAGAKLTTQALSLGAFDFVLKPGGDDLNTSYAQLKRDLCPKVDAFRGSKTRPVPTVSETPEVLTPRTSCSVNKPQVVVIGVSTGGPASLGKVLQQFPANFPLPIVIVQHMPPMFTKNLANDLARTCPLSVDEAVDGEVLRPGMVRIAPGGKQTKFARRDANIILEVNEDPPEKMCRPSVDYLFRSAASIFGGSVIAVIMTGMGDDGTEGCRVLKQRGGVVVAQDAATCVVFGMPRHVIAAGLADTVCRLEEIPEKVSSFVSRMRPLCR